MTHDQALTIVVDLACRWGENAEEALPRRLDGSETDEQLRELVKLPGDYGDPGVEDFDYETAVEVRDLWRALAVLRRPVNV